LARWDGRPYSHAYLVGTDQLKRLECGMRLGGNYYSEWADARGDTRTLLATLVACAVGATASAAVIFSLAGSSTTQSSAPPISPRAIVRNVGAPEVPKNVRDGPVVEPTASPQATERNVGAPEVPKAAQSDPVEPTSRPAAASMVSGRNVSVTQTEAEARAEVHSQQSRRHTRVRQPYWRRFAHNPWPKPFGSW
jgi:hypothetical protein